MINIVSVCGLVICIVLINKILEGSAKEYTLLITILASVIVLIYLSTYVVSILDFLNELFNTLSVANDTYSILLKSLGICIITNLAMDICKDANQNAISSIVFITGKVAILLLSIPLLEELFYTIKQLMIN